jgi:hypothetical protein
MPISNNLGYNQTRFNNEDIYMRWSYNEDLQELTINIESIAESMLKPFSEEKPLKSKLNQIKDYNEKISTFKEKLTNIIEVSRNTFDFTPEEIIGSNLKWRYLQWIVGETINAPEDDLRGFFGEHIRGNLQRQGIENELEMFEGRIGSSNELEQKKEQIRNITILIELKY